MRNVHSGLRLIFLLPPAGECLPTATTLLSQLAGTQHIQCIARTDAASVKIVPVGRGGCTRECCSTPPSSCSSSSSSSAAPSRASQSPSWCGGPSASARLSLRHSNRAAFQPPLRRRLRKPSLNRGHTRRPCGVPPCGVRRHRAATAPGALASVHGKADLPCTRAPLKLSAHPRRFDTCSI